MELSNNKACFFSSIIDFVQNPLQTGDGHSVVGHGHLLLPGCFDAVQYIFAVEHAGSAVDDQIVGSQIFREVGSRNHIDLYSLSEAFPQHVGYFYTSDIFGKWGMGAGFGNQDAGFFRQGGKGSGSLDVVINISLVLGEENGEGSQPAWFPVFGHRLFRRPENR